MLVRHSLIYFSSRIIPGTIEVAAIALYTRLLIAEAYGVYALVLTTVLFTDVFLFNWVRFCVTRFWAQHEGKGENFLSILVSLYVLVVALSGVVAGIVILLLPDSSYTLIIIGGIFLLWVKAWFELHLEVLRARLQPARYGAYILLRSVFSILLGGLGAYLGYGALGVIVGIASGNAVALLILGLSDWKRIRLIRLSFDMVRGYLWYGLPLAVTFAISFIVNSIDRYMIAWLVGVDAAGLYAAAYDIPNKTIPILLSAFSLAATPIIVQSLEKYGNENARVHLKETVVLLLGIGIPATFGMVVLSENIAEIILGEQFRSAAKLVMPIVAFGILIASFKSHYIDLSFQLGKRTIFQVGIAVFAAVLNIALNFMLIPQYGISGAAYATLITFLCAALAAWYWSKRVFVIPFPVKEVSKIIVAAFGMVFCLIPFSGMVGFVPLILQIMGGGMTYGLFFFILDIAHSRSKIMRELRKIRVRKSE
jgi:O-antigen/teichoic acid export membrane protein